MCDSGAVVRSGDRGSRGLAGADRIKRGVVRRGIMGVGGASELETALRNWRTACFRVKTSCRALVARQKPGVRSPDLIKESLKEIGES